MSKYAKIALASLKVIRKDLEDCIGDTLKELGFSFEDCQHDDPSIEEMIERKREKILAKVNKHFDNLKMELVEGEGLSHGKNEGKTDVIIAEIALSIKDLKHHLNNIQSDVNELKAKSL